MMTEERNMILQAPKLSRLDSLDVLRVLACLLITNSHCRNIYPVMFLAVGGGFGNALFFVLSGFLLANVTMNFGRWYQKRVGRLLWPILLFTLINVVMGIADPAHFCWDSMESPWQYIFWYLDLFWFANAILLYYVPFYWIFRNPTKKKLILSFAIWLILYAVLYIFMVDKSAFNVETNGFVPIKVVFYFGVMLLGGVFRLYSQKLMDVIENQKKAFCVKSLILAFLSCVIWGLVYLMNLVFGRFLYLQFLVQFSVMGFGAFLFLFAFSFRAFRLPENSLGRGISHVSAATLEIYLFQVTFLFLFEKLSFPINLPVFFVGVFLMGTLVHMAIDRCLFGGKK